MNGGNVSDKFTTLVTHMIGEKAGSDKHRNALLLELPVLSPQWLNDSISKKTLQPYDPYRIKPMEGLLISVTGRDEYMRVEMREKCEEMGAKFIENFHAKCTHLVCLTNEDSKKKQYAEKWGIPIVSVQWVIETWRNGFAYETNHLMNLTQSTQMEVQPSILATTSTSMDIEKSQALIEQSSSNSLKTSSQYESQSFIFEDEIFYIVGFNHEERLQINKLITLMGATKTPMFNTFSYVLCSDDTVLGENERMSIYSRNPLVKIVSLKWLKACYQAKTILPLEEKKRKFEVESTIIKKIKEETPVKSVKQNLNEKLDKVTTENPFQVEKMKRDEIQKKIHEELDGFDLDFLQDEPKAPTSGKLGLFHGMEFFIYTGMSYQEKQMLISLLEQNQGVIVKSCTKSTLQICPIKMISKPPPGKNVTCRWIQECLKAESLINVNEFPLYQPIHVANNIKFKIHTSAITSNDREMIREFVEILGGEWVVEFNLRQSPLDYMVIDKNLVNDSKSTLEKIDKIKKCTFCCVRVVDKEWVVESMKQGTFVEWENWSILSVTKKTISIPDPLSSPEVETMETIKKEPIHRLVEIKSKLFEFSEDSRDSRHSSDTNSNPAPSSLLGDTDSFANELMELLEKPSEEVVVTRVVDRTNIIRKPRKRTLDTKMLKFESEVKVEENKEDETIIEAPIKKRDISIESQMPESQVFHFATRDSLGLIKNKHKMFLFSGYTQEEYIRLCGLCEKLGAKGSKEICDNFTHLITETPQKSAKFMAALAGKKPILSTTYITESSKKGMWLQEDQYEWSKGCAQKYIKEGKKFNLDVVNAYVEHKKKPLPFAGLNISVIGGNQKEIAAILKIGGALNVDLEDEDDVAKLDYIVCDKTQTRNASVKQTLVRLREINPNFEYKDNEFVSETLLEGEIVDKKKKK